MQTAGRSRVRALSNLHLLWPKFLLDGQVVGLGKGQVHKAAGYIIVNQCEWNTAYFRCGWDLKLEGVSEVVVHCVQGHMWGAEVIHLGNLFSGLFPAVTPLSGLDGVVSCYCSGSGFVGAT